MQTQTQNNTPETLSSLLRGEMSAMETYQKALEKVDGYPEGAQLRQIYMDHSHAVQVLRNLLMRYQAELPASSGAWGTFANAVQATANLFGDKAALKALKEGEEHGIKDYQRALDDPEVATEVKAMIRSDLLRKCETHVPVLDALIDQH
jgi:hypothetical protein